MHPELEDLAAAVGFITRPQILDCGLDDRVIAELLHLHVLERIGPGLYAYAPTYRALYPSEKHELRCHAAATRLGPHVVFSHQSACTILGIATWGLPLDKLHVTRRDSGRGRAQAGVSHHLGQLDDDEVIEVNGLLVVNPARAVWEIACTSTIESGLVTADAALHSTPLTDEELREMGGRFASWSGSRRARMTLSLSDGRSESPGESRSRFFFRQFDIPRPSLQHEVRDSHGVLIGRTDFAWLEVNHLGEFDGLVKYRSTSEDPDKASQVVTHEKRREDRLRSQGFGMSRIVWSELKPTKRATLATRLRAELEQSATRSRRTAS